MENLRRAVTPAIEVRATLCVPHRPRMIDAARRTGRRFDSQPGNQTRREGDKRQVLAADYPFLDILWTMLVFFGWVIWFWLLITVFSDLFRRHDTSGWGKAGWTVLLLVLPFVGVLIHMVAQGKHMA